MVDTHTHMPRSTVAAVAQEQLFRHFFPSPLRARRRCPNLLLSPPLSLTRHSDSPSTLPLSASPRSHPRPGLGLFAWSDPVVSGSSALGGAALFLAHAILGYSLAAIAAHLVTLALAAAGVLAA
jgi:hypothetical protein